jgi:hypothetical protein
VSRLKRIWAWLVKAAFWYQGKLMQALSDVWICSYAFLGVVLLNVAIPRTSQGTELGTALTGFGPGKQVLMALAVAYCALCIWIAASSSLTNAARVKVAGASRPGRLRSTLPFWFALLVPLSAVGLVSGSDTTDIGSWHVDAATLLNIVALVVFLIIPLAPPRFKGFKNTPKRLHGVRMTAYRVHGHLTARRTRYEIVLTVLGAAIFAACVFGGVNVARTLSTWVVAYVAVGFWALWGSRVFIAWPRLCGWPSFWALPIALALLFSNWNDNHEIDGGDYGAAVTPLPSFEETLDRWRAGHCAPNTSKTGKAPKTPCVLRIVAAEGGGLRAAFWTAAVFQALDQQTAGSFSKSVFAVSSISGGSLGTVAYYGGRELRRTECDPSAFVPRYLGDDHLSPVMAGLVFGNALQWFLPVRIPALDRARAFESNMEARWDADLDPGCDRTHNLFDDRFPGDGPPRYPVLFMNSTNVETGKRFILAPVAKPNDGFAKGADRNGVIGVDTYWAFDPSSSLRLRSLPTRTAVTLSASFPLITPAGTAYQHDADGRGGRLWGRLVDGGYFDGTGLATAYDIARDIADRDKDKTLRITIVFISNDPASAAGWENARDDIPAPLDPPSRLLVTSDITNRLLETPEPALPAYPPWGYEVQAIAGATVAAHWEEAIENARRRLVAFRTGPLDVDPHHRLAGCVALFEPGAPPGNQFCEIALGALLRGAHDPRPALGWWLSKNSQDDMSSAARCYATTFARGVSDPNAIYDACRIQRQLR